MAMVRAYVCLTRPAPPCSHDLPAHRSCPWALVVWASGAWRWRAATAAYASSPPLEPALVVQVGRAGRRWWGKVCQLDFVGAMTDITGEACSTLADAMTTTCQPLL